MGEGGMEDARLPVAVWSELDSEIVGGEGKAD